ncbi:MAG: efflux RND transporter periplasmic adaptor subunit [Rivularia sp. (in: Bacteria)]|nr:efflux RND transporter periplasmic adaptor subunit [Rivularia sp. MS3]
MYNQRQHFNLAKQVLKKENTKIKQCFYIENILENKLLTKTKNSLLRSSSILCGFHLAISLLIASCDSAPKETAQATSKRRGGVTAVDTAIAKKAQLDKQISYIGTTLPYRKISVRSQIEGQLLALNVDVGDKVSQGYIVGLIDDSLLKSSLNKAEAELAALNSEVARANTQVSNALTEVETARIQLQQATSDAQRQQKLLSEGAIAQQLAEQSRTEAQTAAKALRLAEKQVQTERQAVAAAKGRVVAQKAVVAQAKERKSYAKLTSPIAGVVLEKIIEPGNLVQPGNEIIKIGDFSKVKIEVQVSELELGKLKIGQSVKVLLDAYPNKKYVGTLKRISPAANSTARLIPVEIVIPNIENKIGSGLLARVNFQDTLRQQIVVPIRAIQTEDKLGSNLQGKIFVVVEDENKKKVEARNVILGDKADGKIEVLSGLQPGESYVVRSGKPLKDGENVRLSILSETKSNE